MRSDAMNKRDFLQKYAVACARFVYLKPDCVDNGVKIWEKIEAECKKKAEVKADE